MKQRLHEIQKLVNDPLIQPALDAVATVELRLGNKDGDRGGGRRGRQSGVRVCREGRRQTAGGDRSAAAAAEVNTRIN